MRNRSAKKALLSRSALGAMAACALAGGAMAQGGGYTVTVPVSGVRSDAGSVMANLCDNAQTMYCATYSARTAAAPDGTVLVFEGVAPGRYALVGFHDENGDGQAQIPPEGYAYGNGAAFPPTFDTASIEVTGDTGAALSVTYIAGAPVGAAPGGSTGAPAPEGVTKIDVRDDGLYGELYVPDDASGPLPAVILLGGSEGGIDIISSMAPSFAEQGYATLALAYWGETGLPQTLENVPLEYFDAAVAWLRARPEIDGESIGAAGWSRGSEAALLLGARNPAIKAVMAIAPSDIVWQGLNYADMLNAGPAWTVDGAGLPYLSTDASLYVPGGRMTPMFEDALPQAAARAETQIPVERINGPVLLVSGGDDGLWPSATFAERIETRLEAGGFAHDVENLVYPDAGHVVFVGAPDGLMARSFTAPAAMMGGSAAADRAAWEDNWPRTVAFFDAALKGTQ